MALRRRAKRSEEEKVSASVARVDETGSMNVRSVSEEISQATSLTHQSSTLMVFFLSLLALDSLRGGNSRAVINRQRGSSEGFLAIANLPRNELEPEIRREASGSLS
jgi:hypothetical protein